MAKTTTGVSFEVIAETTDMFIERRPPARLAKLEKTRKKKKKTMTLEQIEEKLAKAEERRKVRRTAYICAACSSIYRVRNLKFTTYLKFATC